MLSAGQRGARLAERVFAFVVHLARRPERDRLHARRRAVDIEDGRRRRQSVEDDPLRPEREEGRRVLLYELLGACMCSGVQ